MKSPDPRRRSRSNDGTPSHTQAVLPLDRRLRAKLEAEYFEPFVRREPRLFHGPKAQVGGSPAPKLTDEQHRRFSHGRPPWACWRRNRKRNQGRAPATLSPLQDRQSSRFAPGLRPRRFFLQLIGESSWPAVSTHARSRSFRGLP
jgi:hypothetical protein